MADFQPAAKVAEIDRVKLVQLGGVMIAIFRLGDRFYAVEDQCPHRGAPLSDGKVVENRVTCPWHNATFEIPTGKLIGGPSPRDLKTFAVRVTGDTVEIAV